MVSKNNIKNILILAFGFFWCGSVYLTQEQFLLKYSNDSFVNIVELLFGSFSMALGILTFSILYKKNKNVKMFYIIFVLLAIVSMITFFATRNKYVMSVCLCLTCFFGTAGFGAGYHFSMLGNSVVRDYRGRVFAFGYGLGSIGTYLLILLPEKFYCSVLSLFLYIPIILINLFLVLKNNHLVEVKKEKYTSSFKMYFIRISIIVLLMSLLSALSTDIISLFTINITGGFGNTRLYYCLGLLLAGFLVDKKNDLFEILTIVSFVFSLLIIVLLKDGYSINLIAGLSYLFIGFFVLYRTMSFVNLVDNKNSIIWGCGFGLMYSRIMEGIIVLFEDKLVDNYTYLIIVLSLLLSLVIVFYFLLYFQNNNINEDDSLKRIVIKYKLSSQEEKVLNYLVKDFNNQEIADNLYLSINTVRNHVANIYKKTNMKKKELIEKCYYKTN